MIPNRCFMCPKIKIILPCLPINIRRLCTLFSFAFLLLYCVKLVLYGPKKQKKCTHIICSFDLFVLPFFFFLELYCLVCDFPFLKICTILRFCFQWYFFDVVLARSIFKVHTQITIQFISPIARKNNKNKNKNKNKTHTQKDYK